MSHLEKFAELVTKNPEEMDKAIEKLASATAESQWRANQALLNGISEEFKKTASDIIYGIDRLSNTLHKFAAEAHQIQGPVAPGPPTSIGGDNLNNVPSMNYDQQKITTEEVRSAVKELIDTKGDGAAPEIVQVAHTATQAADGPTHAGAACRTAANEVVNAATEGKMSKEVASEVSAHLEQLEQFADSIVGS